MNINPMQMMLNQMMNDPRVKNNPMASNAMKMYQNGDTQGLKNMAENLCNERGISLEQATQMVMNVFKH